jgi:hypothetical protein
MVKIKKIFLNQNLKIKKKVDYTQDSNFPMIQDLEVMHTKLHNLYHQYDYLINKTQIHFKYNCKKLS